MERYTELLQYTAVDREFFEPYGNREIDLADFAKPVQRIVPATWTMRRSGIWMHCQPPGVELPAQGWKIHVSSVASTARIVLSIAAATLAASHTAFKFAADARMLAAINGKRWPRGGSGKFITVYPVDVEDFRRIIDDLHVALSGYVGPYILSDRRYRDSRVLYYRYGGIAGHYRTTADGRREYVLRSPDGHLEPDERKPHFHLPTWLRDPFPEEGGDARGQHAHLGGGRFRIRRALSFSSAGGIYIGDDLDAGRRVIIKEARPYIGGGDTSVATLRKEFRLLRRLAPHGVAPLPVAHFRDWEHSYLVEEYIEGDTLRHWLARRYPWLKTRTTRDDVRRYLEEVVAVFTRFAEALQLAHGAGVSLGDLSFHNCIVTAHGELRLIDLETAVEEGLDIPVDVRTPGFASPRPLRDHPDGARAEDAYAFGANLLAVVMPMNAMLPLDRQAATRFVHRLSEDLGYPQELGPIIESLLDTDATRRASPVAAMKRLRLALDASVTIRPTASNSPPPDHADNLFAYIDAMARRARPDRYVPAGPEVFQSHPWGVAHGAAGVLHAYLRGGRKAPEGLPGFVVDGARRKRDRGTSLMHGDAGIAWVLFDAGEGELAAELLRDRLQDIAACEHAGLHDGLAGWGLARIKAWRETAEEGFLAAAAEAGEVLLRRAVAGEDSLCWAAGDVQPVGLGHGAAGVALFLLHLHVATGDERFMHAADAALSFDLAQSGSNPDGDPTWPKQAGGVTLFPYLRHGTAGIVAVAARFHACTGDARYRHAVRGADADLMRRHAISPSLFDGLTGMGETLLDLAGIFPDSAGGYLAAARNISRGIEPFLVPRDEGLAVPGVELLRLSCDFATGNAGVGAFFDRLHRGGPASFMLDEHLSLAAWKPPADVVA